MSAALGGKRPGATAAPRVAAPGPEPPTERTTYHHGDLAHALEEATVALLAEVGVDALSLREVARRVGVNHRAVYRHYEDKRALLAAVAERGYRALAERMAGAVANVPGGAAQRIVALAEEYVRFARADPARYQLMFGPRLNADGRFPSLEAAVDAALAVLVVELRASAPGAPDLAIRDAGIAMWSAVHGLASLVLVGRVALREALVSRYVASVIGPLARGVLDDLAAHRRAP